MSNNLEGSPNGSVQKEIQFQEAQPEQQYLFYKLFLPNNLRFQELNSMLESHQKDRKLPKPKMHPGRSEQWKRNLYINLSRLLFEVTQTQNDEVKNQLIEQVYSWYYQKLGKIIPPTPELDDLSDIEDKPQTSTSFMLTASTNKSLNSTSVSPFRPRSSFESEPRSITQQGKRQIGILTNLGSEAIGERFKSYRLNERNNQVVSTNFRRKYSEWTKQKTRWLEQSTLKKEQVQALPSRQAQISKSAPRQSVKLDKCALLDMTNYQDEKVENLTFITQERTKSQPRDIKEQNVKFIRSIYGTMVNSTGSIAKPKKCLYESMSPYQYTRYQSTSARMNTSGNLLKPLYESQNGMGTVYTPNEDRKKQAEEVQSIKSALSKYKVNCSYEKIREALMTPKDLDYNDLKKFPNFGAKLLSSPEIRQPRIRKKPARRRFRLK